jgi:hypothetical protein
MQWSDLLSQITIEEERSSDVEDIDHNEGEDEPGLDGLTDFKL